VTTSTFQAASAGAGKDTYMDSALPTTNYGTADPIGCGEVTGKVPALRIPLIGFDISSVPAADHIQSAVLDLDIIAVVGALTYDPATDPVTDAVGMQLLRRTDWVEAEATWNIYKTASNWATAGGSNQTDDIYPNSPGPPPHTFPYQFFQMPQATGAFTLTFDHEGLAKAQYAKDYLSGVLGLWWAFQPNDGVTHTFSFSSDDNATTANRPKLTLIHAPRRIFVS